MWRLTAMLIARFTFLRESAVRAADPGSNWIL